VLEPALIPPGAEDIDVRPEQTSHTADEFDQAKPVSYKPGWRLGRDNKGKYTRWFDPNRNVVPYPSLPNKMSSGSTTQEFTPSFYEQKRWAEDSQTDAQDDTNAT